MSAGTCKEAKCGAPFLWAKTTKGRSIPIDVAEDRDPQGRLVPLVVPDGNVEDTGRRTWGRDGVNVPVVRVLQAEEVAQPSLTGRWRSHFASCPAAAEFSRGRRNPSLPGRGRPARWEK